ncbi:MAG: RagB/SusD family nutrient uptake outer membrane protein [Bacteroidales bacterium]|nr:RagB/SusD family nutrient uptake outer membrane protein [Bacteroidales bacterium]
MKKSIFSTVLAAAVAICLTGCIKETLPTDYVLSSQIASSESALTAMVNAIYTTMAGYSNSDGGIEEISYGSMHVMLEHGTTPMAITGANGYNTMSAYCNGTVSASGSNRGLYPSYLYYAYIKCVNDIIGLIDPDDMTDQERHYLGIAYAYRALYYTDLVQIMEYKYPTDTRYTYVDPENDLHNIGVPIVTENTASEDATNNPRATVDEVYDLVLSDLAKAEDYLSDYTRTDLIEPNLSVIYGQYARVYSALACRTETSETYKDEAAYWQKAASYVEQAINTSGCTPLTEDQWTDPDNGFNNRNSQSSWMWATTLSEQSTYSSSFPFTMIMGTETTYSSYGWRVGRSLDRRMYERLSDNDFRKKSWLAPNFFYESENQVEGEEYLVEKDEDGNFINNKWGAVDSSTQSDYNDNYSGFGPNNYQYRLNTSPSWIRSRIRNGNGFVAWPWLYVNIKFRPHNGAYSEYYVGTATDFPIMRIEEMYFLQAEIAAHTQSVSTACSLLENIVQTRNPGYSFSASSYEDFLEEYAFQKEIEFWGEGVNYFDAKRLELGIHRAYLGTSASVYTHALDMDGVFVGWTPGWNEAELNANVAIYHYNNPYTTPSTYYYYDSLADISPYYGCNIEENN